MIILYMHEHKTMGDNLLSSTLWQDKYFPLGFMFLLTFVSERVRNTLSQANPYTLNPSFLAQQYIIFRSNHMINLWSNMDIVW